LDAEPGAIEFCHCRACRKSNGTAYGANAPISISDFRIVAGVERLKAFESSPGKQRFFCGRCGSPNYSHHQKRPGMLRLRIGLLDTPTSAPPRIHFMVAHKAEWDDIRDDLPQYAEFEPGRN
jgi:hypothetical protein